MKKLLSCLLFAAGALLVPVAGQPTVPDPQAEAGLDQLRAGLIDSFAKADIDRMLTYLAPDVVVTWQNGEISQGPAEVRAYYNRMMQGDKPVVKSVSANPEVLGRHFHGTWAVSWGKLHDHFVLNDGSDLPLNSTFTITTAKVGDRWLVTGYHASVNAFDNPVLRLALRKTALWTGIAGVAAGLLFGLAFGRFRRGKTA